MSPCSSIADDARSRTAKRAPPHGPSAFRIGSKATALVALGALATPILAADVYVALGDSITFGETDLLYQTSSGDRGYPAGFADALAAGNGGTRPTVINLAIDGETASSFMTGVGRTPPVVGRTDVPLALENSRYSASNLVSQSSLFASTVAAQQATGNTVGTVTITLGFNELAALSTLPPSTALTRIAPTLASYRANFGDVLTQVRSLLPNANLSLLGYYNPFPADPGSPAAPIFNAAGVQLNAIIEDLAGKYGASFVDTAMAFLGHEAQYTYLDEMPAGSAVAGTFGGTLPIGNVHPNAAGYAAIAAQVASVNAVPEPSTWTALIAGFAALGAWVRRRRTGERRAALTRTVVA